MQHSQGPPLTKICFGYLLIEKGLSENTISSYAADLALLTHFAYQAKCPIENLRSSRKQGSLRLSLRQSGARDHQGSSSAHG